MMVDIPDSVVEQHYLNTWKQTRGWDYFDPPEEDEDEYDDWDDEPDYPKESERWADEW